MAKEQPFNNDAMRAVERAIAYMRDNLGQEITINDIAHAAMFSKFHFTRLFLGVTGMSPRRFLSAIRIQQAMDLLLSTDMTVTDISYQVGYNSMGTFCSRFRESVGLPPKVYRQRCGLLDALPNESGSNEPDSRSATVSGRILAPQPVGAVFIGLFPESLPHGRPIRWTQQPRPGTFQLDNVRPGRCFLVVDAPSRPDGYVAVHGPIILRRATHLRLADLRLRPRSIFDPPMLLAHLDVVSRISTAA